MRTHTGAHIRGLNMHMHGAIKRRKERNAGQERGKSRQGKCKINWQLPLAAAGVAAPRHIALQRMPQRLPATATACSACLLPAWLLHISVAQGNIVVASEQRRKCSTKRLMHVPARPARSSVPHMCAAQGISAQAAKSVANNSLCDSQRKSETVAAVLAFVSLSQQQQQQAKFLA